MIDNKTRVQITYDNFCYYNVDLKKYYLEAGEKFAAKLINEFGIEKNYIIICGLAGNGGDGLATALSLMKKKVKGLKLYLIGRSNYISDTVTKELAANAQEAIMNNKSYFFSQDCYANDIESGDIIVEALVGTGLEGKSLNKRYKDVIKRITHFNKRIIAVDLPTPHYAPYKTYSINYPKTESAEIIQINYPAEIESMCGPGELAALWKPKKTSHKTKNGSILHFSDNESDSSVINKAANIYSTMPRHFYFDPKHKGAHDIKSVDESDLQNLIQESDSIIFGNISPSIINFATTKYILENYNDKTFIFFGDAIKLINLEIIKNLPNLLVVLSRMNLTSLFQEKVLNTSLEGKLKRFSIENNVHVLLTGSNCTLYSPSGNIKTHQSSNVYNPTYQATLAGLIAAYSTKNDLWLSMCAGTFEVDRII